MFCSYFRYADVFRQSAMVFTEQTGLDNLYSIVNYCINKTTCKRNLIAEHFSDTFWSQTGECGQMCDFCSSDSAPKNKMAGKNLINEALFVLEILEKHSQKTKEKRITGNKLAETVTTEMNKQKKHGNFQPMDACDVERLILVMIMRKYLKEDFHFTPYSTICYLLPGYRSSSLFNETEFSLETPGAKSSATKTESSLAPSTSKMSSTLIAIDDDPDDVVCLDTVERTSSKRTKYDQDADDDDLFFAQDD